MASLNIKTFAQLVSEQIAAVQGRAAALVDFTVGSLMLSFVESNGSVMQWLQQMLVVLLTTTRAATSTGSDLVSWFADYGFTMLEAVSAKGNVTYSRFTPTNPALVPVGALVGSTDGSQQYAVVADATNPAYSSSQNGYVLAAGAASVTVPVVASIAGAAGNALANQVTVIVGGLSGIDTVNNTTAFLDGEDAETAPAARVRFIAYINSLSKAVRAAIENAVISIQPGVICKVTENLTYAGVARPGYFYVVADDGSGNPPTSFMTAVTLAVDAVMPIGSKFDAYPPVVVPASVAMTVTVAAGYDVAGTKALVSAAITAYLNALTIGQDQAFTLLTALAYGASAGVINVTGITLNGGVADLIATDQQVIKAGAITIN